MAKEFKRDDLLFSLCGLNCSLCPMFVRKSCAGCIENSMCYNTCNIAPCSIKHGVKDYCYECNEYPCDKYDGVEEHDSLMTHINQLKDIEKAQKIGIDNYHEEQRQKVEILDKLLETCNYQNNKEVFFCTAVNLIPLADLKTISENVDKIMDNSIEERYEYIKDKLYMSANNNGVKLELRKGKYNAEKITF